MTTNKNQMLEDFLNDNHIDDNGFTEQVMRSLPTEPKLIWLTSWLPILGLAVGTIICWAMGSFSHNVSLGSSVTSLVQPYQGLLSPWNNFKINALISMLGIYGMAFIAIAICVFSIVRSKQTA